MKLAIMQPYFLPYIGYFQLINSVEIFVIYDNIQFTKKGWINRNRILVNGKDDYFTIPLKKDSDYLNVNERMLAVNFQAEGEKFLRRLKENYRKAPQFLTVYPLLEAIVKFDENNLFRYILNSVYQLCSYLDIKTDIRISSQVDLDHSLKSQEKVIAICKALDAKEYINPIGGIDLYSNDAFNESGIELKFIKSDYIEYSQGNNAFVPWLSIIDVLMFNSLPDVCKYLNSYKTIRKHETQY